MSNSFGKLAELTLKGYKSIQEIDSLRLEDVNIVIGQNGAGKSNFISIFRFLSYLVREELQDYVTKNGGIEKILYFGPRYTSRLEISFRSFENEYRANLAPTSEGTMIFVDEVCSYNKTLKNITVPNQFETQLRRTNKAGYIPKYIMKFIENWRVYHFHDTSNVSPLRGNSLLTEMERLDADGGNLPAFLYYLQEKYPKHLEMILDEVRRVAPFFGSFILRPEALNQNLIRLRWRHRGKDNLFDVSDLSDGTLRFIALTALLLQPNPPDTIVLDEPELGLHPAAITQLAALMHQVSPTVQIVAATQSPTFVNHFGWQDFIIADRVDDASRFRRLTENEVGPWADEFGMGEIWEKNLIGGRP